MELPLELQADELLKRSTPAIFYAHDRVCYVEFLLENGHTVHGRVATVNPAHFSREKGFILAREEALKNLVHLMAYADTEIRYRNRPIDEEQ
jgi:hypothetical protein